MKREICPLDGTSDAGTPSMLPRVTGYIMKSLDLKATHRAGRGAGTAGEAGVGVDNGLAFGVADGTSGAGAAAGLATNAFIGLDENSRHDLSGVEKLATRFCSLRHVIVK